MLQNIILGKGRSYEKKVEQNRHINITTGFVYTPEKALLEQWALGSAVMEHMGYIGFILLIISLAGAVAGGINGFMLSSSKLIGALGHYKMIPEKYNRENNNGVFDNGVKFVKNSHILLKAL